MKTLQKANTIALTAALTVFGQGFSFADPAASGNGNELIAQVLSNLKGLSSVSANFQEIDSHPGQYRDLKQAGVVYLSRPNKVDIEIQRFRRVDSSSPWGPSGNNSRTVSDGSTYSYAFIHPHSTQVQQVAFADSDLRSALRALPSLAEFFGQSSDGKLPGQAGDASLLPNATLDGESYQVVQYPVYSGQGGDAATTAYIGSDLLVHKLVYSISGPDGVSTREWDLSEIKTNAEIDAQHFAYLAPADATILDNSVSSDILSEGTVAPDFTAYNAAGKPVKLSDYKGKTVILDFWATWCWPCNQSLPHTEKIAEQFKGKDVAVLAVAIRDSKTGFDEWLKRHHYPSIDFVRDPNPEGKDIASTLYGVSTTPTAYVIDSHGTVVSVIEGYSGPTTELAEAVSTAVTRGSTVADAR